MEVESGSVELFGSTLKSLLECKENGEVLSNLAPPSIYMVPSVVRDLSPSSFTPSVVAIGPLHRQDEHLKGFEAQKTTYLHNWLDGLGMAPEQTLRECLEKVIGSIERIKACYAGLTTYDDFELAKMMVIDACFILEFIHSVLVALSVGTHTLITGSIWSDMLLIENQIPFFVLENIFECTALASGRMREGASVTRYFKKLLRRNYFFQGNVVASDASTPDHILGLFHKYFRPAEPMPSMPESSIKRHTAMELHRAGMKFKPYEDENWALAMKLELPLPLFPWFHKFIAIPQFSWFRPPTLRMQQMHIGDGSELILRNLVVYEQAQFREERYFTSYLIAMDMLINTPEDVAMLEKSKVLWEEMDAYYTSYWPHTVAGWKLTYFNNPWSIIALFAAFVLFALTVVQTIFTIKAG
ncbi:UPF0481 protein At3g47200 isoform X2 [Lactuca sativa]|uniref:UPF0481 protein At3g47200 isoform X2 n=1 Tax=Lactuca sativa TaxID=4236 RepID=UPI000CD9549B|nr:UPF0481 protein At3g47200 isoform X2 [Lactuca sativa]